MCPSCTNKISSTSLAVLSAVLSNGADMAEAGEFTKRAFLNGKLSLASAEGMADMINASSMAEVRAGALLLKPDMSHLETWPDVFTDGETCAFFDWDAENLREQAHRYAGNESERIRIAENAARVYRSAMDGLAGRFQGIIREVLS